MSEFVYFTILKKSNVLIYRPLSHAPSKREYRRDVNIMKNKKYNNRIQTLKFLINKSFEFVASSFWSGACLAAKKKG